MVCAGELCGKDMESRFVSLNARARGGLNRFDVFVDVAGKIVAYPDAVEAFGFAEVSGVLEAVGEGCKDVG